MPSWLRMFIGKPAFRTIAQELFDGTLRMAKQYVEERQALPAATEGNGAAAPAGYGAAWSYAKPNPAMPVVPPIPRRTATAEASAAQADDRAPMQRSTQDVL